MEQDLGQLKKFFQDVHVPGTYIQVSSLTTVYGYSGETDLATLLRERHSEDLYFLAGVPRSKRRDVPHLRTMLDIDITRRKSLMLDIDIRKSFQSAPISDQAVADIVTCLPDLLAGHALFSRWRYIVHSGNGAHIYYVGEQPTDVLPAQYARGYKHLVEEINTFLFYNADPSCCNLARIARMPGSVNHKNNTEKPVFIAHTQDAWWDAVGYCMTYKHTPDDTHVGIQALVDTIRKEPILTLCDRYGIKYTKDHYVIGLDGEKSSIRINTHENYVHRFSGKAGSGTFLHLYAMLHNLTFVEACKEIAKDYAGKKLVVSEEYAKKETFEQTKRYRESKFSKMYVPLSWNTPRLNTAFPPIKSYSYIVMAGETKSGKSTVAFDLCTKNALAGHKILYITLEMSAQQLRQNVARAYAGINPTDERAFIQSGEYPIEKRERYHKKMREIESLDTLIIHGKKYGSPMTIDTVFDLIVQYHDLSLVVIDNLDKLDRRTQDRDDFDKQKSVSQALLEFTTELHLPVILVHHLRKGPDTGKTLFRNTNSLSGTSKISHDADMVLFVARKRVDGQYTSNETFVRVAETREFSPVQRRIYFVDGVFQDDDPADRIFKNAYISQHTHE